MTDNEGATGSVSESVTVTGDGPVANFTFSPSVPTIDAEVTFDAAASFDPDGSIVEYHWDWGDGTSPTIAGSRTATHTFAAAGSYTVVLTVRDGDNQTGTASVTIVVGDGPVADFTFSPSAPTIDEEVTFDAGASFDPGGSIVEYRWDWGDGTSPTIGASRKATHTFTAAGSYTVVLTVRDGDDQTDTASVTITVS